MKTMQKLAALLLIINVAGCKAVNEVTPETGTYLVYTNMPTGKFDKLTVKLNNEEVGTLTLPFVATIGRTGPECSTPTGASVLRLERPLGSYSLDAVATLNGKQTGKWSSSIRFESGDCKRTRFVQD